MTPDQITALRAACLDTPAAAAFFTQNGAMGLKNYLNAAADPSWTLWRTLVTKDEIMLNGFDWTRLDNLSVGKYRIWVELFDNEFKAFNPSKANVRAGIDQVWTGTAADLAVRAVVYTHCKRLASNAEQLLSSGVGSNENPAVATFEGEISDHDAAVLIFKDDGSIWTA